MLSKYRLLCVDRSTGITNEVHHFKAANDGDAVCAAEAVRNTRPAELWRTYRVIQRWP
jgi:hypothetical protein